MFEHVLFSIWAAAYILLLPILGFLEHRMIAEINRTGRFAPISHWHRIYGRQHRELEDTYRKLFPDSWKPDIYNVARRMAFVVALVVWLILITGLIANRNTHY